MRAPEGAIKKLGPNHYRIRVHLGYDGATGKPIRVSRTIRGTLTEARSVQDELKRQSGLSASAYGKMSVYEFVKDEWLPTRKLRATTYKGYTTTLENHVRPHFSTVKLKDLTPLYISRVLRKMEHQGAAQNVYKMLRSALRLATNSNIIDRNPINSVEMPQLDEYEADTYDLEEVLAVLEAFRGNEVETGVIIAATCGLRRSETCALDWSSLTLDRLTAFDGSTIYRGTVEIVGGYHVVDGERIMTPPKTKRSARTVAIPGFAVKRLLEIRGDGRIIGPIMIDTTGQRMTPDGFTARWYKVMRARTNKSGEIVYEPPVRYIPLKNLRHSQSTILLDLGATMHEVAMRDGHASERTTDMFYNKPRRRADHSVAERFDEGVAALMDRANKAARSGK